MLVALCPLLASPSISSIKGTCAGKEKNLAGLSSRHGPSLVTTVASEGGGGSPIQVSCRDI